MALESLDEFCGDNLWNHQLSWNTSNPDVTLCLQRTLLSWVPCIILWILAPLEVYFQNSSVATTLSWTGTNISRMTVAVALGVLCLADAIDNIFNKRLDKMFHANLVSAFLKSMTFLLSVILMGLNRRHGRHTSGVLFIFWTCLTVCEIFSYRSAFLQLLQEGDVIEESAFVFQMIYFPLLVSELILSCVADIRNKPHYYVYGGSYSDDKECPEQSASFLSRLIYWWFNGMAIMGWKKPLTIEDLWQLNPEDRSEYVAAHFDRHWRGYKKGKVVKVYASNEQANGANGMHTEAEEPLIFQKKGHQVHIVRSLCKTFWSYFVAGSIQKAVYDLLMFVNPVLLRLLIGYVEAPNDPLWKGVLFAVLMFLNGCLQSIILGDYFQRMFILGMRIRTALVSAIYQKALVLSSASRRESTTGEVVNLMSVDSQRFMDLMPYLNMLWSAPLQILIAVLMLWQILGPSVLAGLLVMVILIPLNAVMATQVKKLQVKQMAKKDERVKLISEVLSGIKVLKLYAWEEAFKDQVINIRNKEISKLKHIAYLNSVTMLVWNCSPFFVSLASFASFVLSSDKNVLDATTAFVSLALFNILRFPLTMLPNLITTMVMVSVSVKRINKFLNSEEIENYVIRGYPEELESSLVIKEGHFSWSSGENETQKTILKDINMQIEQGSLVAIVGQVGCGKSSLLSTFLGEMEKSQGSVHVNGTMALVSQQPWIQNTSLMQNILFSQSLNKKRYNIVLDACGLMPDLAVLPGGDQTEIGEKGINLSGGQKQRVSLARAVYSNADIYLLDDPLSAVDSHVGRHIFERVIGPNGLLSSKTRVLVTHGLTYLPQTDVVVVMKEGKIAEIGSFQQLVDSKGPFSDFLSQYLQEVDATEEERVILEDIGQKNPQLLRSLSEKSSESEVLCDHQSPVMSINQLRSSSSVRSASANSESLKLESQKSKDQKESLKDQTKLIQIETAETGEVHSSIYINYLKAVGIIWVMAILFTHILWQVFSVGANVWLSDWGDDSHGVNNTQNIALRNMRLGVYAALGIGQGIATCLGAFAIGYGTLAAANSLHTGLLSNILHSPMSFFDTTPLGRIVNRFAKDIDTMDVTFPMTVRSWLACFLQVVATLIVISIQTPQFLIIIIPIGVLYYVIQRFYVSTSRQLKRLESITRSPIYSHFSETLAGSSTIRAYDSQDRFCKHSSALVDNNQICYYPSIIANRWLAIRLDFCGNCIILFAALFAVLGRDYLDPGKVGLSVSYALMVTATLNWMVRMASELETNIVAVERILEYTNMPTEAAWVKEDVKLADNWPQEGNIKMIDYSSRYREGLDLALKGITCNFSPSEKVGIVGRTGAGKSSLTLSLFRIIEAAGGSIMIDDVCIADIGLHQLRSKITIIPQDPVLFSGTLRINLDPFSWYTDSQLWEALEHAHLKEFVLTLDSGLSHEIVEGGENLSVGQRQLVCLARALLRKTKILVLDEATAAVDLETDDLIQATIRREFADCSVLTIAHRLNTVMDYDRIMVLSNGCVVEFNTPENLLKDKMSVFYGMAKDSGLVK